LTLNSAAKLATLQDHQRLDSMAGHLRATLCLALCVQGSLAAVLRTNLRSSRHAPESYSFAQFIRDFERSYEVGSQEYQSRAALFQASLERIHAVNAKNLREGRAWSAGVHPFMDWSQAERRTLNGYKHSPRRTNLVAALQTSTDSGASTRLNATWADSGSSWEGVALRQQGSCGSCWAISAVEAIEARLPANSRVSAQALVDCVPNPRHCGGKGGCDGATGELAYEFARDHGLPLESSYAYTAETGSCPMNPLSGAFPAPQRARVSGWANLPSNKAQPLMEALYSQGPVVVAVDANEWFDYDQGVFDGCQKDAELGHAVLAKGYGGEGSGKYWRIQNSWGANWGEQGHIRMKRQDPAQEEAYCGQDRKPQEGLGCDGGPPEITVCGMCGILYDPLYPTGVTLEGGDSEPSQPTFRAFHAEAPAADVTAKTLMDVAKSDEERMHDIFQPEAPAVDTKKESETNAVDQMKELLGHSRI
jgi:cathepsin L